jgi:hypothetical protein
MRTRHWKPPANTAFSYNHSGIVKVTHICELPGAPSRLNFCQTAGRPFLYVIMSFAVS